MKKFNKKNLIIYAFLIIYLLIGKFFVEPNYSNVFYYIYNPFMLIIISILAYFFNKDIVEHKRKKKDLMESIIIIMMSYMIIYFISGLLFDYAYSPYNHSIIGILKNLWSFVIVIIFQEYIRYNLVRDSNSNLIYILIILIFIFNELNFSSLTSNLSTNEAIFKYFTSIIIPVICHNVVANYLVLHGSYKVSIIYLCSLELLTILLPIFPNLDWFMSSFYEIVLAIIIYALTSDFYEKKVLRLRKRRGSKTYFLSYIPYLIVLTLAILFMAGFFKYKPVAIMSNSMYPNIKRGDTVISKKISQKDLKLIKLNDIIEYKIGGSSVIHRVIAMDIDKDGNLLFVTKGDNNEYRDDEKVKEEQVVGIVDVKIPYVGYPTVWFTEFLTQNDKPDVNLGE